MFKILIVLSVFCACNEKKAMITNAKMNYYDSIDNSLSDTLKKYGLLSVSDSIKWNLYCIYGADSTSWGLQNKNLPHIPIGFLELRLMSFTHSNNDTLFFYYQFIYEDSIPVESYDKERKPIASEVMVKLNTKEIIGYGVDFMYSMDIDERYKHPLRIDIITFMKSNRNKLNTWFKQRAIEKGIL